MTELKTSIEQYIKDNWVESPVFWFGTDFDAKNIDAYIQVKVLPNNREILDLNSCNEKPSVFLEVYAYANTYTETFAMLDRVFTMMQSSSFDADLTSEYDNGYQDNNMWFNIWRTNIYSYNEL